MDKEDLIYDLRYFNNIEEATDYLNEYHIHKDDIIDLQYHPMAYAYVLVTWNEEKWQKWKEKNAEPPKRRDREPDMERCHFIETTSYNTEFQTDKYIYNDIPIYFHKSNNRYNVYCFDGMMVYVDIYDACKFIENNMHKFIVED